MYVDTHLHLDEPWLKGDDNRKQAIADITKNKIVTFAQSCDIPSYEKILEYSSQSEYIFPAFGILPWYAHEYVDRFDEIAKLCEEAIMLGEIGLDELHCRDKACIPHQLPMFEIFLREAEKNNKIMNCHFRGKVRESLEILESYKIKKAIFHSYSGEFDLMKDITDAGYYYSMGPYVFYNFRETYEKKPSQDLDKKLIKNIQEMPDDLFILEIDCLPRDDFHVPSVVFKDMLEVYAKIRNITPEKMEAINYRNVLKLVGDDPRLSNIVKLLKQ